MLVNEDIEELHQQNEQVQTYVFNEKPLHAEIITGFSSGQNKNVPHLTNEQAWIRLEVLG